MPASPINLLNEAFDDPQVRHQGMRIEIGNLLGIASPIVIDSERTVADLPPPARSDEPPPA